MKSKFITLLLLLFAVSCSNDNNNVLQRLNEAPATVREVQGANSLFVLELANNSNGLYSEYIVPSSALSAEYKEDGLSVLISGDVTNNSVAIDGYISEDKGNTVTLNGLYNTVEVTAMNEIIEIPITEYSLVGTDCWRINTEPDKIIVINSNNELEKYMTCSESSNYPAIDFSKYTLLLANGGSTNGIREINTTFLQYTKSKYALNVIVRLDVTMVAQGWNVSILVPKIAPITIITLNVTQTYE